MKLMLIGINRSPAILSVPEPADAGNSDRYSF
jgi:hypothetical protein